MFYDLFQSVFFQVLKKKTPNIKKSNSSLIKFVSRLVSYLAITNLYSDKRIEGVVNILLTLI